MGCENSSESGFSPNFSLSRSMLGSISLQNVILLGSVNIQNLLIDIRMGCILRPRFYIEAPPRFLQISRLGGL